MYFLVVIICVGTMLATGSVSVEGADHLLCYSCEDIHTSEDCMNVTTCTGGEDCYGRADGMPNGEVRYTVGCTKDTTAVMGVHTFCTDECHENRCNINKCHMPISPKGNPDRPPRCLSCDLISSPSQCTNMVQCLANQICYAREITVYGNQRYRLGCIDKQHCSDTPTTQAPTSPQLVGKRSLNESCSLCCGSDHCNALACDSQQHHSLGDSFELKLLGSKSTCKDSNPMACASFGALNTEACGIVHNVDTMCPKTCGVCGHFGWSSWNGWSSCSTTCNDGTSHRSRTCLHQISVSHPQNCIGNDTESNACNLGHCLVEGNWTDWESWGECSRTCSNGTYVRVRQCQSPSLQQGSLYCPGERLEESECYGQPCLDETSCPDQWIGYHNSCYFFVLDGTTFNNGQAFCQHREATLVHIESSEENQFLVSHLLTFKNPGDGWWIGMMYKRLYSSHYEWQWYPENTRVTYTLRTLIIIVECMLCYCVAQQTYGGFMPGSSPATPNLSMDMCQRQATSKQLNVTYSGKHAEYIRDWCTKYEEVLPCIGRVLPTANSASDWYLKLIYDKTMATRMSKSVCARFPFLSNLTCVEKDMPAVGKCMHWTTKSAIDRFFGQFVPNEPLTTQKKKMASIYACIISVATAGCFHKELSSCSKPHRKLMYDFYIMMSGNCREIAGIPETTTREAMTTTLEILSTTQSNDNGVVNSVNELRADNNSTSQSAPKVSGRHSTNNNVTPSTTYRRNGATTIISDFIIAFTLCCACVVFLF